MQKMELLRPKFSVLLSGDLVLRSLLGSLTNPRTLGLGLFFSGGVGEGEDMSAVVAVELVCSLSKQSLKGRLWW